MHTILPKNAGQGKGYGRAGSSFFEFEGKRRKRSNLSASYNRILFEECRLVYCIYEFAYFYVIIYWSGLFLTNDDVACISDWG